MDRVLPRFIIFCLLIPFTGMCLTKNLDINELKNPDEKFDIIFDAKSTCLYPFLTTTYICTSIFA